MAMSMGDGSPRDEAKRLSPVPAPAAPADAPASSWLAKPGYSMAAEEPVTPDVPEGQGRCENCGKNVPLTSIDMHIIHCRRNFSVCPRCSMVRARALKVAAPARCLTAPGGRA
jgi:hypothetical protein